MTIIYFILALIALGVLVFIHELGHYIVARRCGMKVEIFSIGFGKPLLKWKLNGVDWQLGCLPFGGFVKIVGMDLSKKEKDGIEPHNVEGGFFAQSPLKRMAVAFAGPLANFLLAFILIFVLWAMGGREKSFSEYSSIIGWVDPRSEIYALGVRPGDILTEYNGKPYKSSKDLLYATMLGDRKVELKGYHVNYETKERSPFTYTVQSYKAPYALNDILTTGITTPASYLIYDRLSNGASNPLPEGSPMIGSGIEYGDRIVWAEGELIFSQNQLSYLLNDERSLLTVKRGDQLFLSRQKRMSAGDFTLPSHIRNELTDWQYEAGIKSRWQELKILPYILSADAIVEGNLHSTDQEVQKQLFPTHPLSKTLEAPLEKGDRIVAVDGIKITSAYQLLDLLQARNAELIVERGVRANSKISAAGESQVFVRSLDVQKIDEIASTIGSQAPIKDNGPYVLLRPVQPKPLMTYSPELAEKTFAFQQKQVDEVKDGEKRSQLQQYLQQEQNKYLLGISLQDRTVVYNPSPFALFGDIFSETAQTLKALVFGYLNPKWLSGPIGIVQVIQHGWKVGLGEALFWISAISINLAVLNLLPIPILDGGYIFLSLWELVTRKRVKPKVMERLIIPFVILLVALLVFLTFQDITRLF